MTRKRIDFFIVGLFILLPIIFFRQYFFSGKVPFSANLLVSYYTPFRQEVFSGFEHGVPNKPMGFDNLRIFYPHLKFTIDQLKKGKIPLWNPYNFSGNVHLGLYQTSVFYPLNFIYFILPMIEGWSILVVVQPVLSALFMYLFLRVQRLKRPASLFGALAFAYGGWMIAWWEESLVIEHSILWLPLALYCSSVLWQGGKHRILVEILFTGSLVFSVLAGFFQMTLYLFVVTIVWNIYQWFLHRDEKNARVNVLVIIISLLVAILLTALQWLPALEAYLYSPRSFADAKFLYDAYLMPLRHLFTLIAPDYWGNPATYNYFFPKTFYHEKVIYLGIFPLLFFLYSLLVKLDKRGSFWKIFSLITLSLGFQIPTSWIWYLLRVPVLSSAQPSRIFVIASLGMSVLAAYGLEHFMQKQNRQALVKSLLLITLGLLGLWSYVVFVKLHVANYDKLTNICLRPIGNMTKWWCAIIFREDIWKWGINYTRTSLRNLIIPSVFVLLAWITFVILKKKPRLLGLIAIMASCAGSYYFAQKFLYFSERKLIFPPTPLISKLQELSSNERIWGYGNAYTENNILSYYGLYSAEGYDPFFSKEYAQLINTIRTKGKIENQLNRADVDLSPIFEDDSVIANIYRFRLFSLLGVNYVVESKLGERKDLLKSEVRFPPDQFRLIWEDRRWKIWKFTLAYPRAFLAYDYIKVNDKQAVMAAMFDKKTDLRNTIILEEEPASAITLSSVSSRSDSLEIKKYSPDEVIFRATTSRPGLLFLSDTYDPGWQAYIDNQPAKILRADYAFRAVPVTQGIHVVRMIYNPAGFRWGTKITLVTFVSLILLILARRKQFTRT